MAEGKNPDRARNDWLQRLSLAGGRFIEGRFGDAFGAPPQNKTEGEMAKSFDQYTGPAISHGSPAQGVMGARLGEIVLPATAVERIAALKRETAERSAIYRAETETLQELRAELHVLKQRLEGLQAGNRVQRGLNLDDDNPSVVDCRRKIEAVSLEIARFERGQRERDERTRGDGEARSRAEQYLREIAGALIVDCPVDVALKKGETLPQFVERSRFRIRELRADKHRVDSAPFSSEHALRRLEAIIDDKAARGLPDVSALIEAERGGIYWSTTNLMLPVVGEDGKAMGIAATTLIDIEALIFSVFGDAIKTRLSAEILAIADDAAALTPEQRAEALAEIESDMLQVERQEAAAVWQLRSQGHQIAHRADVDPRAFLGIDLRPAAAEPAGDGMAGVHRIAHAKKRSR